VKRFAAAPLVAPFCLFTAIYYSLFPLGSPRWLADAVLLLPAGAAMVLHMRRAGQERSRSAWFWRLIGIGCGLWIVGTAVWSFAEYRGFLPSVASDHLPLVADFELS